MKAQHHFGLFAVVATFVGLIGVSGCNRDSGPVAAVYEPNWVYAYQMGKRSDQSMDVALDQTTVALTELFGTVDEPKLPEFLLEEEDLASVIDLENVIAASGPTGVEGRGLYRKHCATCHGITGNGRGPTAALVTPYPRDYRLGRFKFKSTPIGTKPTKDDIKYLIKQGIPGSSMVKIPELTDDDIDKLTDYVIFLSWRGEVERSLLMEAGELYFDEGDSLYDPSLKNSTDEEQVELWEEQVELLQDFVLDVVEDWYDAEDRIKEVPARDASLVPDTSDDVLAAVASGNQTVIDSIERGRQLFVSDKTACSKCHGAEGKGDGQTNDYDEWTKDWTKKFGLDPEDEAGQVPLIARGALPVRKVTPRNFEDGIFHGGSRPEQLFLRISLGIEGTPMPAAAVGEAEIWDLVNFVRSLYIPKEDEFADAPETEAPEIEATESDASESVAAAD